MLPVLVTARPSMQAAPRPTAPGSRSAPSGPARGTTCTSWTPTAATSSGSPPIPAPRASRCGRPTDAPRLHRRRRQDGRAAARRIRADGSEPPAAHRVAGRQPLGGRLRRRAASGVRLHARRQAGDLRHAAGRRRAAAADPKRRTRNRARATCPTATWSTSSSKRSKGSRVMRTTGRRARAPVTLLRDRAAGRVARGLARRRAHRLRHRASSPMRARASRSSRCPPAAGRRQHAPVPVPLRPGEQVLSPSF